MPQRDPPIRRLEKHRRDGGAAPAPHYSLISQAWGTNLLACGDRAREIVPDMECTRIQPETTLSCVAAVLLEQYPKEGDPLISSSTTPHDPCGSFLRSAFRAGLIREKNNLADLQA